MSKEAIKKYLKQIGSKGGSAKGKRKSRGDRAYYQALAKKAAAAKKKKKKALTTASG